MPGKEKFKIARAQKSAVPAFEAMLNPASYKCDAKFDMACDSRPRGPDALTLPELVFDGTGVVPTDQPRTVAEQIAALEAVIFNARTSANSATYVLRPLVVLTWGSLRFTGRVTSLSVDYTLFAPNGAPLRARVALQFAAPDSEGSATLRKVRAPTPVVQIPVQQARLPQLCFEAFGDPGLDRAVARANGLDSIRNVPDGTQLVYAPD
jgi:hypothetical protein